MLTAFFFTNIKNLKIMKTFKTYNLKLDEESYFKLKLIEMSLQKSTKKKVTKSEAIATLINDYKKIKM
jgi:hypothetical protein